MTTTRTISTLAELITFAQECLDQSVGSGRAYLLVGGLTRLMPLTSSWAVTADRPTLTMLDPVRQAVEKFWDEIANIFNDQQLEMIKVRCQAIWLDAIWNTAMKYGNATWGHNNTEADAAFDTLSTLLVDRPWMRLRNGRMSPEHTFEPPQIVRNTLLVTKEALETLEKRRSALGEERYEKLVRFRTMITTRADGSQATPVDANV